MSTRLIAVSPLITKRWFTEAIGFLLKNRSCDIYKFKCEIISDPINAQNMGLPEKNPIVRILVEDMDSIKNIESTSEYIQGYIDALMCVNNFTKEEE